MTAIRDQAILVTGANRGVGREFVKQFLERGARKVYAASRDATAIEVSDGRIIPLQLDVTDAASIAAAARIADDVSIVVNNAGISEPTSVLSPDLTALRAQMEVNFVGPVAVASAFAVHVARNEGAVINVHSVLSWLGLGGSYSASKAALWSATESMRLEFEPRNVQVLGLFMGFVDTDMTAGVTAPKASPADIVAQALDGLEAGESEVFGDDVTRAVHATLNLGVHERYLPFTAKDMAVDIGRSPWP